MEKGYRDFKQTVMGLMDDVSRIALKRNKLDMSKELEHEKKHLNEGELYVVVCGECKRGKSSLINAFLSEPDLCPVDAPIATNAISIIRYGEQEKYWVTLSEKGENNRKEISRNEISQYVTEQGNENNYRKVISVGIELNNSNLKDGLVIVDTPGVGSLNVEHTAITYGLMPMADVILFVGDASNPLTMPELDFCKRVKRYTTKFLHVLTKCDLVNDYQDLLKWNRIKLANILECEETQVEVVAVSNKLKLDYISDQDEEFLQLSGFAKLEEKIWDILKQRGDILLGRALDKTTQSVAQLRLPLATEYEGLTKQSKEELEKIENDLKACEKRGKELSDETAFWINDLNDKIKLINGDVQKSIADQNIQYRTTLEQYLKQEEYLNHPQALVNIVTADFTNIYTAIAEDVGETLSKLIKDLRTKTSLNIPGSNTVIDTTISICAPDSETIDVSKTSKSDKLLNFGGNVTMTSVRTVTVTGLAGAFLGFLGGLVVGGPGGALVGAKAGFDLAASAGLVLGTGLGMKKGYDSVMKMDKDKICQVMRNHFNEQITCTITEIKNRMDQFFIVVRSDIYTNLMRQIKNEIAVCQESIKTLSEARRKTKAEAEARIRELDTMLHQINRITFDAQNIINTFEQNQVLAGK